MVSSVDGPRPAYCRAAHETAAPPSSPMDSRRFDHLVGGREQRRLHVETECFGGLQVDHQLELPGGRAADYVPEKAPPEFMGVIITGGRTTLLPLCRALHTSRHRPRLSHRPAIPSLTICCAAHGHCPGHEVERWRRARITSLAGRAGLALRSHRSSRADIAAFAIGPLTPVRTLQALGSWWTGRPRWTHLPFVAAGDGERRDDNYRSRQLLHHRHNCFPARRIGLQMNSSFSDGSPGPVPR
jgi:hypothetical protein